MRKILLVASTMFLLGFISGKYAQLKIQKEEINKVQIQYKIEKAKDDIKTQLLTQQVYALKNGLGVMLETKTEPYDKNSFGVYSPLLVGKPVQLTTYQYRDATIVGKRIEIDQTSSVEIWEYEKEITTLENSPPEDFVTFGGYENYAFHAITVNELRKNWQDLYKNKNGISMYYSYEFTPKNIGVIGLNSYHAYFNYPNPKPVVLSIWYNKVGDYTTSKDSPFVLTAKKELNKIADTFEIVAP